MKDYRKRQLKQFKNRTQSTFNSAERSGRRQDIIESIQQINRLLNFNSVHNNLTSLEEKENSDQLRNLYSKLWVLDEKQ